MAMTKQDAACRCFAQISNGSNAYYITCQSTHDRDGKRNMFKTTAARLAHFNRYCMKRANGCHLYQPEENDALGGPSSPLIGGFETPSTPPFGASGVPAATPSASPSDTSLISLEDQHQSLVSFDYSELDTETADIAMTASANIMRIRTASVVAVGRELAPVRERLSSKRSGTWQAWCRSIGMSEDTAMRYIRAFEWVSSNFEDPQIADNIQTSVLFRASAPSAMPALQEMVRTGDITTSKEYQELEQQLRTLQDENRHLATRVDDSERWANANAEDLKLERKRLSDREAELGRLKESLDKMKASAAVNDSAPLRAKIRVLEDALKRKSEQLASAQAKPLEMAVKTVEVLPAAAAERMRQLEAENESLKANQDAIGELTGDLKIINIIRNSLMKNITPVYPVFLDLHKRHVDPKDPVRLKLSDVISDIEAIAADLRDKLKEA